MALVAGRGLAALTLATAVIVGATSPVLALEIDAYLRAASSGVAGEIVGRVLEGRRRPDLPERPLEATVTLLPQPEALTRRLEDIKRTARDSDRAFRTAIPRMLEAAQDHERAVRAAGGAGLIFNASTGGEGTFTVPGVPAGPWILLARHETLVPGGSGSGITRKDRQMYRIGPTLEAYRSVRLWVREVTVGGGRVETTELTDRNVWFSGVIEVRSGADRAGPR